MSKPNWYNVKTHRAAKGNETCCDSRNAAGYWCTRPKGHKGNHVAHVVDKPVKAWSQKMKPVELL